MAGAALRLILNEDTLTARIVYLSYYYRLFTHCFTSFSLFSIAAGS